MLQVVDLSDFESSDVEVTQQCVDEANSYVERVLLARGIDPAQIDPNNEHLKELAKTYALYKCYLYSYRDGGSPYKEKADQLYKLLKDLEKQLTPEVLGIESQTGHSFGVFRIQRGS